MFEIILLHLKMGDGRWAMGRRGEGETRGHGDTEMCK
jgi:hypothetical protein